MRDSQSLDLKVTYNVNLTDFINIGYIDIYNKYGKTMLDDIYKKNRIINYVLKRLLE